MNSKLKEEIQKEPLNEIITRLTFDSSNELKSAMLSSLSEMYTEERSLTRTNIMHLKSLTKQKVELLQLQQGFKIAQRLLIQDKDEKNYKLNLLTQKYQELHDNHKK